MTHELDLEALLREPIVRLMMASDGVASGDLRQLLQRMRSARTLEDRASAPSLDATGDHAGKPVARPALSAAL